MEKKVFLAIALSLLIMLSYSTFMNKMYPPAQQEVIDTTEPAPTQTMAASKAVSKVESAAIVVDQGVSEELLEVETEKFILVFSNIGGRIKEVILKDYSKKLLERDFLLVEGFENVPFEINQEYDKIILSYQDQARQIVKTFYIDDNSYSMDIDVSFRNLSGSSEDISYRIYNSRLDLEQYSSKELAGREKYFMEFSVATPEKVIRNNFGRSSKKEIVVTEKFEWAGVRDRYFCSILYPISPAASAFIQPISKQVVASGIQTANVVLAPNTEYTFNGQLYIGPQNSELLSNAHSGFENIVNFGVFNVISKGLLSIMRFLHSFLHSWGISVILISILIYLVLYPLTAKSLISMKRMQALQPEIEKLREALKDQPQKLNKELMELYRDNKVNPFGGCLPMFLQIPVFFGLYQALMRSIELKGAEFLWIKDLADPDRLIILKSSLPIIGDEINLLPLIMVVAMFFQQKLSMKSPGSSTMQEQQKMMMIFFPILFGFLFYHFPSGLTLYWVSYTILSIFSQRRISHAVAKQ